MKDLTGKRFGRLVAQFPTPKRDTNHCVIWQCKCDCGNTKEISSKYLLNGRSQSCGCIHHEYILNKAKNSFIDLKGKRFGKLVVLEKTDKRNHEHIIWKCKCDCGNICYVSSNSLNIGDTHSCGCIRSKGEQKIINILNENNIRFELEKKFSNCKFVDTNACARFDFYLPNYNLLIEYDGKQHFESNKNGWFDSSSVEQIKKRDSYKNEWCKSNGYKLIRISYKDYDNIDLKMLLGK